MPITEMKAYPFIVQNTFISVDLGQPEAQPRRSSSLPPMGTKKASETFDYEAATDICTEASDEVATFSDSGHTSEGEPQDECLQSLPPPPTKTKLNPQAAMWAPSAVFVEVLPPPPPPPLPMGEGSMTWRVGKPKIEKWLHMWKDTVSDVVAKMSLALGKNECVTRVECHKNSTEDGWTVIVRSNIEGFYQFERLQTAAKEALLKEAEETPSLYILGHRRLPFHPTPMGFCATLGTMTNTKKACWDLYSKGFCPRSCTCTWEHPALMLTVNVMIDFTEKDSFTKTDK
jgi:hypothetical protein|mmetsp:Transcript_114391/g.180070  ORF Transcript_114391/g.180070 Transcript_114391/m.180070 type:complete len:287 (-) Transcript_114391:148-1008(-)